MGIEGGGRTMHAPTTTIETVTVVRPLKVLALLCLILSLILLVVCLATSFWLRSGAFRTGLFEECTSDDLTGGTLPDAPPAGQCQLSKSNRVYIKAVATLLVIGALLVLAGIALTAFGLASSNASRKYLYYRIAMYFALLAVLLKLIGLVVFPVCFYLELKDWGKQRWEFDWSYGVAWGSTLFTFGAALLLICDKEHEEIYYKEKTLYNSPGHKAAAAL